MKKAMAILVLIVVVAGWYATVFGFGSALPPIKDQMKLGLDLKGGVDVLMEAKTDATGEELKKLMNQTQAIIEKRVNAMGLSEPIVLIEGDNRIRVQLPGAENADDAINSIGKTALLQFVTADGNVVLDGSMVKDAGIAADTKKGGYAVTLEFNDKGSEAFKDATTKIMNRQITSTTQNVPDNAIMIILDGEVISSPGVSSIIPNGKAEITGGFTADSATNLSVLIRGGALPVELHEVQTQVVGPTLGMGALKDSVVAGVIGIALILIVLLAAYQIMGIGADIALLLYVLIVLWVMVLFGGVMTLPGIAGLILSAGMAVDANVIIFSRIKEEVLNGKSVRVAVNVGFKRAMSTVLDSQATTMIAGIILYEFGTGSVKGFALTLMIGIVASILTAVFVTQLYLDLFAESKHFGQEKFFGVKGAEKHA